MPELIDKHAAIQIVKDRYCSGCDCEAEYCIDALREMPTVQDVNRAEILRLCNEIEEFATEIRNHSESYAMNRAAWHICRKVQAIGKELTGDAGSKTD